MKKSLKRVLADSIILILTIFIGFLVLKNYIRSTYYGVSVLYIYHTFVILLVIHLLIDIGRIFLAENNYKKYIGIFFPIFGSLGIYFLSKNLFHSSFWGITDYTNLSVFQEFLDFYNMIYNLFLTDDKLWKMLIYTNLFYIVLLVLYFSCKKLHGKIGYILERITRNLFQLTPVFLYMILVFQLPYTYYYPRRLQYIFLLILIFIIGIIFYRIFISLMELRTLNRSFINKDTLLVIMNQDNFSSKTIGLFKNPLSYFKNYNIHSIINNLVIRSKNYSFVSYDAIRYDLVKLKGYKNIGYVFLMDNKKLKQMNSSLLEDYKSCINTNIHQNKHFVFLLLNKGYYTKDIQNQYRYQCIDNIRVEDIVNVVHLTKEDILLHDEVFKTMQNIPNNSRFTYISSSLDKIIHCYDDVEILYSLLKIGEYVVHYRALKNIVDDSSIVKNSKSIVKPAFGVWATLQNTNNIYTSREIIATRNSLIDKLDRPVKDKEKNEVTFMYLVNLLVTTRNKYIGHGSISNKKARELNYDIFIIIRLLIEEFKNMDMDIKEDNVISNLFDKDIYAIKYINNNLYLYMNNLFDKTEYLDYGDGKIYIANTDNTIYLNKEEGEYAKVTNNE